MQIIGIQNYSSNQNFTAKIIDSYALRKFKAGLSAVDADAFEKLINDIEKVDDGKKFVYEPMLVGNKKIAKICEIDKQEKPINPPRFVDYKGRTLEVFKQMASWYKKQI